MEQLEEVYHSMFMQRGQIHNVKEAELEEVRRYYTMVMMMGNTGQSGVTDEKMVQAAQDQQRMWDELQLVIDDGVL